MKKTVKNTVLVFLVTTSLSVITASCSKSENGEDGACKTCKAYGTSGIDAQQTVCSAAEESAFREQNAGKEISCN